MFPSRIASVLGKGAFENNYSLVFDGSNDYVNVGTSIDAGTTSTISLWIKRDDPTNNAEALLGEDDNSSDYFVYLNKHYGLYVRNGSHAYTYADSATTTAINTTDWIHIAVVRETVTGKLYINGVLVETEVDDGSGNAWSANTAFDAIGAKPDASAAFGGNIDEVAVWNKALSAGDISALYQARGTANLNDDGNSANLKGWWRMGDGVLDDFGDGATGLIADQVNPTLGSEELTNGSFVTDSDWNKGTGVTISGGQALWDTTGTVEFNQSVSFSSGKIYKVVLDIASATSGSIRNNTGSYGISFSSAGTYTEYIAGSGSTFYLVGSGFDGAINSVSVKEVNGNAGLMTSMASDDIVKDTP